MFEITEQDGAKHATNGVVDVSVMHPGASVFKRRAIKGVGTPQAREVCWLVVRIGDTSIYVDGQQVVVSDRDLNP